MFLSCFVMDALWSHDIDANVPVVQWEMITELYSSLL
jgi:hypothetical protein